MLYIYGNDIALTRGDSAYLTVPITTSNGEEYTMQSNDTLTLTVKKDLRSAEYAFQKIATGNNQIHIEPQDTSLLEFGKYKYDVQLNTSGGDVYTVIPVSVFEVLQEVTC